MRGGNFFCCPGDHMDVNSAVPAKQSHIFLGTRHEENERKTRFVIALTAAMMLAEIIGGKLLGSMALYADGWHMSTHAGALAIATFAYAFARRHKDNPRFAFGTGKLGDLAGFTSAIILGTIGLIIVYQAVARIVTPTAIVFGEAIAVASLGLVVNIVSAWLLSDHGHHHHDHDHGHDHHEHHEHPKHHHDNNLRSAYMHVMADAATSVLAIIGLMAGWIYGWVWMDPVMGIVGACVIVNWSYTLIRDTGRILLDVTPDETIAREIRERLEKNSDQVTDLHLWQIGPGHYGVIVSLESGDARRPDDYKALLAGMDGLSHVTVEVNPQRG